MVQYNSSAIYLIGGYYKVEYPNGAHFSTLHFSRETWIFDPQKNFEFQKGPPLSNTDRYLFSCAKMKLHNNQTIIVVAGGLNITTIIYKQESQIFDTVEWFLPELGGPWRIGPNMPYKVYDAVMTTSSGVFMYTSIQPCTYLHACM